MAIAELAAQYVFISFILKKRKIILVTNGFSVSQGESSMKHVDVAAVEVVGGWFKEMLRLMDLTPGSKYPMNASKKLLCPSLMHVFMDLF